MSAFARPARLLFPYALCATLLAAIAGAQLLSDRYHPVVPQTPRLPAVSAATVRMVNLGLHLPLASLLWIDKRLDVLTLKEDNRDFLDTLAFINGVDPQFSTPYAFSVLVMPSQRRCSYCQTEALEIGKRGIANAEPDWRIPFYMAVQYFTTLKDKAQAAHYFDVAAHTPGAPSNIRTFSLNYSTAANEREESKKIWRAIADAARDQETKARAEKYLERMEIFDMLESAVSAYRKRFGVNPETLDRLVGAGMLPFIPTDPFGYALRINQNGTIGFTAQ